VRIGFLQNAARDFRKTLVAPSSSADPCPRMDTDQEGVRGNAPREKE